MSNTDILEDKTTDTATAEDTKKSKAKAKTDVPPYDPWADMCTINLPIPRDDNEDNFVFISVNGRNYKLMKNGRDIQVPRPIYEVWRASEDAKDEAALRRAELKRKSRIRE